MIEKKDVLSWIQNWFYCHCNGDWEHNQNILIENLDNPGWSITIKLGETELKNKNFEPVNVEIDDNNWYYCRVDQGNFEGAGGPFNLNDLLWTFRNWVELDNISIR